jgi:adenine-specific DNA-methyltransferase
MSRLSELLRQVALKDARLAADLKRETDALAERRAFGLNFERHVPEAVELPGRPVRKNDKVRCLPPRGEAPRAETDRLWRVDAVYTKDGQRWANIVSMDDDAEEWSVVVEDLVVVAEFRDPIYPGLVSTGKVERGGTDKPYHAVINAENFHALQSLLFTHRGEVDAIYIDPPYNTGAKDWKYNNDYVESDDLYRHSKWLAMMERRLLLAKELLNPDDSVLIVTIDEKEYLRLGLLLEQTFPDAKTQMVTSVISQNGTSREGEFSRVEEYLFMLRFGGQGVRRTNDNMLSEQGKGVVTRTWVQFSSDKHLSSRPRRAVLPDHRGHRNESNHPVRESGG